MPKVTYQTWSLSSSHKGQLIKCEIKWLLLVSHRISCNVSRFLHKCHSHFVYITWRISAQCRNCSTDQDSRTIPVVCVPLCVHAQVCVCMCVCMLVHTYVCMQLFYNLYFCFGSGLFVLLFSMFNCRWFLFFMYAMQTLHFIPFNLSFHFKDINMYRVSAVKRILSAFL